MIKTMVLPELNHLVKKINNMVICHPLNQATHLAGLGITTKFSWNISDLVLSEQTLRKLKAYLANIRIQYKPH